jgi:hypothetical protein
VLKFPFRAASRYSKASERLATLRLVTRYVAPGLQGYLLSLLNDNCCCHEWVDTAMVVICTGLRKLKTKCATGGNGATIKLPRVTCDCMGYRC